MGKCCSRRENVLAESLKNKKSTPTTMIVVNNKENSYERVSIRKNSDRLHVTDSSN